MDFVEAVKRLKFDLKTGKRTQIMRTSWIEGYWLELNEEGMLMFTDGERMKYYAPLIEDVTATDWEVWEYV